MSRGTYSSWLTYPAEGATLRVRKNLNLVTGYDLLLAGLERERATGTPEQARLWEAACLRYPERFGPRLDPD
jgi:hypothetical protein